MRSKDSDKMNNETEIATQRWSVGLSVSSMPSVNTRLRAATATAARYMWWAATLVSDCVGVWGVRVR